MHFNYKGSYGQKGEKKFMLVIAIIGDWGIVSASFLCVSKGIRQFRGPKILDFPFFQNLPLTIISSWKIYVAGGTPFFRWGI